jgi:uncharacterized iron-regulated membrane protein
VTAILRGAGGMTRVYLDPPSAKVLDVGGSNDLAAWLHQFHESLNLRDYGGRAIVGWVGVGMLISSLTGVYLWWPAAGVRRTGVGFRRGFRLTRNLHYTLGFFGCVVLAMLSFTGIALAFPDTARSLVGSAAPRVSVTAENADQAAAIARREYAGARITVIALPQSQGGAYRVSFAATSRDGYMWMRVLHEGSAFNALYRFVVFLGGLLPATLVVTGLVMWLRTRRRPRVSLHVPAMARDDRLPG